VMDFFTFILLMLIWSGFVWFVGAAYGYDLRKRSEQRTKEEA
jgi:hypothetical protein